MRGFQVFRKHKCTFFIKLVSFLKKIFFGTYVSYFNTIFERNNEKHKNKDFSAILV